MDEKVLLLLFMVLFSIVKSQSTTSLPFNENRNLNNLEEQNDASNADMQASDSTIRFLAIDPEDGKNGQPDNGITSSDDDDDSGELELLKTLLDPEFFGDVANENSTTERGNTDNIKLESNESEEPLAASNTDKVESRSHGPELNRANLSNDDFSESKEEKENVRSSSPFEQERKQMFRNEPSSENSPQMQLTQGGYRRPFQTVDNFRDQRQSLRSESVPLQAEVPQIPNNNQNPGLNQPRQQRPYNSIFQPPYAVQPGPVFRHPFSQQPINFANTNGRIPSNIQNSFYNTQADVPQGHYPQLHSANDFPTIHFAVQTDQRNTFPNQEYMFQAPFQIPASQSVPAHMSRQIPPFFQHAASPGNSNNDNTMFPAEAGFQTLFGNLPQSSPQFQENQNPYSGNPNLGGSVFANPAFGLLPNFPSSRERTQFTPRFINPLIPQNPPNQMSVQNRDPSHQIHSSPQAESQEKSPELLTETPNKEDPVSVPFGARIQRPNEEQNNFERQDNMYIRYPIEAGYATQESLPAKNESEKESKSNEVPMREPFPFFSIPRTYNIFDAPDPYRAALANAQGGYLNVRAENVENKNETEVKDPERLTHNLPIMPNSARLQTPTQIFRTYPERTPDLSIPEAPFYPIQGLPNRNPFEPIAVFPDNRFQFVPRPIAQPNEEPQTPVCAKATNASICFEDPEYPRGEILYALNSDSFLTERMVMPDQDLEKIPLIDQNETESNESEDNYICKSDIKYGLPLRAETVKGKWKVIVNMERPTGRGNYIQPIRLEICRGMGDPCTSVTEIRTACVQKYSLQRLLSWTVEKGVHNDIYKIPIACSCQILQSKP